MTLSTNKICRSVLAVVAALAFAGCVHLPPAQAPLTRREVGANLLERDTRLVLQSSPASEWPTDNWWHAFNDEQLDRLIEQAIADAPSMQTAAARVRLAEQVAAGARAQLGAKVDLDASLAREKLSHFGLIPPPYGGKTINDAEGKFGFSYDFDWWGKQHAALAASLSEAAAARADNAAAVTVLTSAVAQSYYNWQALQARLVLANAALEQRELSLRLTRARLLTGLAANSEVAQMQSAIALARQNIDLLQASQHLAREQLRHLLGAKPDALPALVATALPTVQDSLPADAGLDLLARRPDVQASRERVEAASHRIDTAKAEFYPDISISAFLGVSTLKLDRLLSTDALTAGVAPAIHLPIFDAGRLRANLGVANAELDVAIATYNQAVVDAASDVATQATTLADLGGERIHLLDGLRADEAVRADTQRRLHQGLADARDEVAAQLPILVQQDQLAQIDAQRLSAQIALLKALGGGYRTPAVATVDP